MSAGTHTRVRILLGAHERRWSAGYTSNASGPILASMGRSWVADVPEHAHREQLRCLGLHAWDDVQGVIVNAIEEWASRGEQHSGKHSPQQQHRRAASKGGCS